MKAIYFVLQITWGAIQSFMGLLLFLTHANCPHYNYKGAVVTEWKSKSSVSLGLFIFVSDTPAYYYPDMLEEYDEKAIGRMILVHEYGHTIQSLILGPLYVFVIGIPSLLWSFCPVFIKYREREGKSYFSAYCEKGANDLGEKVTGEQSMGQAMG